MLFAIHLAAMNGVEPVLDALDSILVRAEDEIHEIEIIDADEIESSDWYKSSRPDRRKMLEEIAQSSLYRPHRMRGPHLHRVDVSDTASAELAKKMAYTPLLVLLENDISDGALVAAAIKTFASPGTQGLCFGPPSQLSPPAFQMESRGGHGELKKLIATRLDEAAKSGRPARFLVVTDSDGEWPGDVKEHAKNIREECAKSGIPCPPLNKRTAENYIPDAVLRAWSAPPARTSSRPMVIALQSLSKEQRDYIHMADPGTEPWDSKKPSAAALFSSVSPSDHTVLTNAKMKGKRDSMLILALNDHKAVLTPAELNDRDHQGDLLALVKQIEDAL